jgi:hypothetical protein
MENYKYFGLDHGSKCEDFLKKTTFFVEGDKYTVWKEWKDKGLLWDDFNIGHAIQVGTVESGGETCPVNVTFSYARVGDTLVTFYSCDSRCCDWTMIENYLTENYPIKYDNGSRRAMVNSNNFHNCYHFCQDEYNSEYEDVLEKEINDKFRDIKIEVRRGDVYVITTMGFYDKNMWIDVEYSKNASNHTDNVEKISKAIHFQFYDVMKRFSDFKEKYTKFKESSENVKELVKFAMAIEYSNKSEEEKKNYMGFDFTNGFEKALTYIEQA